MRFPIPITRHMLTGPRFSPARLGSLRVCLKREQQRSRWAGFGHHPANRTGWLDSFNTYGEPTPVGMGILSTALIRLFTGRVAS